MNGTGKVREPTEPTPLRVERSAAALVAQYIHELSERHTAAEARSEGGDRHGDRR